MREYALERLQADRIATGHYARLWHRGMPAYDQASGTDLPDFVEEAIADAQERDWIASWGMESSKGSTKNDGCFAAPSLLLAGADLTKDQSYFLCGVDGRAFLNVLFPLGELVKMKADGINNGDGRISSGDVKSVRDIAIEAGLPTASKRESMGICFIGKRSFQSFISQYLPSVPQPGNFIDVDTGEVSIFWLCNIVWLLYANDVGFSCLTDEYICPLSIADCWETSRSFSLYDWSRSKDIRSLAEVVHCRAGKRR